jgi:tetratricopeptide (TPR) repeat protein
MKNVFSFLLLGICALQSWSCGILQTVAVQSTTGILDQGMVAIFEESDLQLAEQAIASDLKLLEALHKSDPDDDHILLLLVEGYTGYALGFVEDRDAERAKGFYRRARDYGLLVLNRNKNFVEAFNEGPAAFKQGVEHLSAKDLAVIFWTANAWGNLINLSISDPEVLGDLYKVNALMDFVLRTDERFFYGSAHLYVGTILATTPRALGGNPERAREHFEKCLSIGERKFLLPLVYYASSYAVQVQNAELFDALLNEVNQASIDLLPEQRLVNMIAKQKAKILMQKRSELF